MGTYGLQLYLLRESRRRIDEIFGGELFLLSSLCVLSPRIQFVVECARLEAGLDCFRLYFFLLGGMFAKALCLTSESVPSVRNGFPLSLVDWVQDCTFCCKNGVSNPRCMPTTEED